MTFQPTEIPGCVVVRPQRHADARGHFARTWDGAAFARLGLTAEVDQCSVSFNERAGTLRGMHFQIAPHEEAKLVRCTRGALFDVCLDLRPDSPTYRQWHGEALTADNGVALFVPEGCAHGFLTLEDATEAFYMISAPYAPDAGRVMNWSGWIEKQSRKIAMHRIPRALRVGVRGSSISTGGWSTRITSRIIPTQNNHPAHPTDSARPGRRTTRKAVAAVRNATVDPTSSHSSPNSRATAAA